MSDLNTLIRLLGSPFGNSPSSGAYQLGSTSSDTDSFLQRLAQGSLDAVQHSKEARQQEFNRQYKRLLDEGRTGVGAIGANPVGEPLSIGDQLQQQLAGIQPHTTPLEELQRQASAQVNAQFDPQINQLLRDMGSTKNRAVKNEGEVKNMYNSLAQNFADQLPDIQQQMQQQQGAVANQYGDAKSNLQQQYDQQKNQQQAVLQQLGLQAAAPDSMNQAATDQSYFQQQNQLSQNQALDQLTAQGNADQNYTRDIANSSRLEGTNAANDIASQLEAYLQNAQGQVSDLKGAKSNSLAALVQQLQQQDAQNAQSQYNNQFDQMMQLNNFQRSLTNDQNQNQMDEYNLLLKQQQMQQNAQPQSPFKGTSGMTGMSNYLSQQYPDNPNEASALGSLVASVLSNADVQMGKRQDGMNTAPITNEYLIQLLRNNAEKQGVTNPMDINNAIDALLAYKGQLR
jgi:hypothetical protein